MALREDLENQLQEAQVTLESLQGDLNVAPATKAYMKAQLKNKAE